MRPRSIARGIELFPTRTPTLPPAAHTNSYALGGRDVLLVEPATPYDDERRAWLEWVRAFPAHGRRPVAIVLTHHHPDHVGGAAFFAKELGLPLWAHAETAARLPELSVERMLADGDEIVLDGHVPDRFRVLHTPGHAWGHICLHQETASILVVGDMVASVGTIVIAPGDGDMAVYLAQLDRLARLNAALALPAHGEPISDIGGGSRSPTDLFRYYVRHRLMREAKVVTALGAASGGATLEALVSVVYSDTPRAMWTLAALSLHAHLLKLEGEGKARRVGSVWVRLHGLEVGPPRDTT